MVATWLYCNTGCVVFWHSHLRKELPLNPNLFEDILLQSKNRTMMQPIYLNDPPVVDAESQEMEMQERRQFMESPVSPTVPDSAFAPNSMSTFKRGREDLVTDYANKGSIAPEQEIIVLAFRLAILEKVASGLGTLAFVWATIVLLGGFAGYLDQYDFWVIWALLVTEGTRVFSKSHEVEWQHAAGSDALTVKVKKAGASILHRIKAAIMFHKPADTRELPISKNPGLLSNEKEVKEDWSGSKVPVFPSNVLSAQHISFLLHSLQLASSLATVALSLSRLIQQIYINMHSFHNANNLIYGLNLFYSLSLAEATVEKAYWEYQINCRRALLNVTEKARLDDELLDMIQMFFYDVYSTCLKGSVLHGLDMDLVGFSIQKIMSDDVKEQLGGALILSAFITQHEFAEHTIRKIDTTPGVIERLLEMLTWKNSSEKEIRRAAAYILSQLVRRRSNCYRITLSSGALEGIISLLIEKEEQHESKDAEKEECKFESEELKLFGLQILKSLAKDHRSSLEIGSTPGLLAILVSLIEVKVINNLDKISQWKIFKKTLQLLKQLVSAKGKSGKMLRSDIGKAIFTLRNLRNILESGGSHIVLQELTLDILINLALDDEIRDKIGGTGGILRNLVDIFFKEGVEDEQAQLSGKAGEVLSLLVLQSSKNCKRILNMEKNVVKGLLEILRNRQTKEGICAAYILQNLCPNLSEANKAEVVAMAPFVLQITLQGSGKELES